MIPLGFECPNCGNTLAKRAIDCGCGWSREIKKKSAGLTAIPGKSEGVSRCAWITNGEQCHYPGTISHNTAGMDPWYCRFHAQPDISAIYGHEIVVESRTKPLPANPDIKGCQEIHCVRVGHRQPNGHYLCYEHCKIPNDIEYANPGPKGRFDKPVSHPDNTALTT